MDDETKASLAAAIAGGYILGRTKKGRLALTAVTFLLGRRLGVEPQQLVTEGVRRLREVPQVSELEEQVRTQGIDAARNALSSVVGRGLESVTGPISSRLPGAGAVGGKQDQQGHEDEHPEEAEEAEEASDRPAKRRRREAEGSGRPSGTGHSRAPAKKKSAGGRADRGRTAERTTKKTAAKRAAPAKRAASTATKKTASPKRAARSASSRPSRSRSDDRR